MSSILTDTKKILGIAVDYTVFDLDVLMHINSAFSTLSQLGIGPEQGFEIGNASSQWVDFFGTDLRLNSIKTYVYLRVRLVFDPPTTSYLIDSLRKQLEEIEWRLNVVREETAWINPLPPLVQDVVYDGGTP